MKNFKIEEMERTLKLVTGRSGMLGLGASVGSMAARAVDGVASAGEIVGIGLVLYVIITVIANTFLKDV